jgi:CheY-like chemotaxis protein
VKTRVYDSSTVLVVDDEPIQRQIASRMLRMMTVGEVVETDDGARALEIIEARGSAVDLVICDLEMPKMDGMEFIRRLADIAASPALIINSSHTAEILESVGRMGTAYGLRVLGSLEKPLTRSALAPCWRSSPQAPKNLSGRRSSTPRSISENASPKADSYCISSRNCCSRMVKSRRPKP